MIGMAIYAYASRLFAFQDSLWQDRFLASDIYDPIPAHSTRL